ncbi:MAG TPA: MFS transporter [Chloroflexota bacterium]|nr:MFS transporter [Chloroflexota bacterium]
MARNEPTQQGGSYWPTVALVLLATCPGLINGTGLSLATLSIAGDLKVAPVDVSWVSIMGNAGLGIGTVLAADLTQRVGSRRLLLWCLAIFTISSVVAALSPSLSVLVAARVVQGLSSGLLLITAVPPLVTGFPPGRIGSTFTVLIMAFFGVATAGPLVGGVIQQHDLWRWLFVINALFGVLSIVLTPILVTNRPAPNPQLRIDAPALLLAIAGPLLAFFGCAQLGWHGWGDWQVFVPLAIGIAMLILLLVVEVLQEEPLMPVRLLGRPIAVAGIVTAIVAGTVFTGTLGIVPIYLERVRDLSPQASGLLFWPGLLAATVAAILIGRTVGRRWQPLLILAGMLCLGIGALALSDLGVSSSDGHVQVLIALLGLGAGLTVAPAMFLAAFSVPPAVVGRALAMVSLVRLAVGFVAAVPLTHAVNTNAQSAFTRLSTTVNANPSLLKARLAPYISRSLHAGATQAQAKLRATQSLIADLQHQALLSGLTGVFRFVFWLTVVGTVIGVALFVWAMRQGSSRAEQVEAPAPVTPAPAPSNAQVSPAPAAPIAPAPVQASGPAPQVPSARAAAQPTPASATGGSMPEKGPAPAIQAVRVTEQPATGDTGT